MSNLQLPTVTFNGGATSTVDILDPANGLITSSMREKGGELTMIIENTGTGPAYITRNGEATSQIVFPGPTAFASSPTYDVKRQPTLEFQLDALAVLVITPLVNPR